MSYTPPIGSAVDLILQDAYTSPTGDAVALDFDPPPANTFTAALSGTLENASGALVAVSLPSIQINGALDNTTANVGAFCQAPMLLDGVLGDVTGQIILASYHDVTLDGVLDDASGLFSAVPSTVATLSATTDDIQATITADWQAGVWRGIANTKQLTFNTQQSHLRHALSSGFLQGQKQHPQNTCRWRAATPIGAEQSSQFDSSAPLPAALTHGWTITNPLSAAKPIDYDASPRKALDPTASWAVAGPLWHDTPSSYDSPPRKHWQGDFSHHVAISSDLSIVSGYEIGRVVFRKWHVLPWEIANPHSWIWGGWPLPPLPPTPPYVPDPNLVFKPGGPDGTELNFDPIKLNGVIIVLHTVHVVRLPDLTPVPTLSASLQLDSDSWAWGVSLNLQTPQAMALLEPVNGEPRQVRIELDGLYFNALIESWGEQRQFGETLYTAQGRSPLALLAAPFAPQRSRVETLNATAAQLIDYELTNTGWSAAYHADLQQLFVMDWQIPGGAWSYQNLAPVEAIARVAKAVGARAFADKTGQVIHIAPRYPVSPWHWATANPDKTLPVSLARSINTQLNPQPAYNQVYVSGTTQGVIVSVKRTGSAGDHPAPMVTDAIMTHADAGRERGRNILGNTGRQARVTFDLPLNPVTGLFEPGQLVAVQDSVNWRGLVTAVNLQASHGAISQSVELERHYA